MSRPFSRFMAFKFIPNGSSNFLVSKFIPLYVKRRQAI